MKKLFIASALYLVLGLVAGVFYRDYTKAFGFPEGEYTQLSTLHTHLLTLGFLAFLVFLVLDKLFSLSPSKLFTWFFWVYNVGFVMTITMMVIHGMLTVQGVEKVSPAISGIAGLGHTIIAAGLVLLMISLGKKLFSKKNA